MAITLQVTLFDVTGRYRPLSTLISIESMEYYKANASKVHVRAIQKICAQRYTSWDSLKKSGYAKLKVREYNKEKIVAEQKERYEKIKKERGWT